MKSFTPKRKSISSLDALLKATATGTETANTIDKALNTPTDRIMKTNIEFEKTVTIKAKDSSEIEKYTVLKATIEDEKEAARKLKQLGITTLDRQCHVNPIPPAYLKCKKINRKSQSD
uniref:Ribosomal_L23eN domain-containing protein n=1 Tax=Caenorhabditis tropicalis TaxID=1561998 RepID=A0A1I7TKV6_9PELO